MIGKCKGMFIGLLLSFTGSAGFANPPVHYVENKNQWPADFHFGADFPQMKVMLKDASIFFLQHTLEINDSKSKKKLKTDPAKESHLHGSDQMTVATFELNFIDALQASITASEKQKTIYNYFSGNDPSKWASKAAAYGEILYSGIYKGIDLKVYSEGDQMKYDWIVSPCADHRNIRFEYKGVEHLELRDENLVIESKLGEVVETKPYAYQVVNGHRRAVAAAFEIDDGIVSFIFPEGFDSNYELVIDPFLIFSTYSGSTLDNWGNSATPDSKGNLYSGGMVADYTAGTFPTTAGAFQKNHAGGTWDVGILKYDSVGANVLYVTYIGGSGVETPQSLVVNQNDELLVLGATSSTNFPGTTSGTFKGGTFVDPLNGVDYFVGTDIFIAKLSVDGSQLLKSTYLGGTGNDAINFVSGDIGTSTFVESPLSRNYGDQLRGDIITDASGNVYVASNTTSTNFPVINTDPNANYHGGTHDGIVVKLDPNLSMVWSRLIGGSGTDAAFSIKFTPAGNILVAGGTTSTDIAGMNGLFTTFRGEIDGWIAELSAAGDQVINETYIGTSKYDQVYFVDVATNGDVLVYGQTRGSYPISNGVYSNPGGGQFLHRLTPNLKTTVFSTVFGKGGNAPDISPTAFLVNACDNIYMAGWGGEVNDPDHFNVHTNYIGGNTTGLPVTSDAWQKTSFGNDFYFMVLTGNAQELVYATFLGGTISPTHVDGGTSRFDKRGIVYHAVCAGCGRFQNDFPAYNVPVSRSTNRSPNCSNAAFKFDLSSLRAGLQTNNTKLTMPGFNRLCLPDSIVFQNLSIGGEIFEWNFGDGPTQTYISRDNIKHYYKGPGTYTVKLKAIDHSTCIGEDSVTTVVEVYRPNMNAGPDQTICFGSSTHLTANGAAQYLWKTIDTRFSSDAKEPLVAPADTAEYFVTMTDADGCILKDTVVVNVVPGIDLSFNMQRIYDCQTRPVLKLESTSQLKKDEAATFLFGDGQSSGETETVHTYERDGTYTVSLQATKEFCTYQVSKDVPIVTLMVPNVITPGEEDGLNDTFKIRYGDSPLSGANLKVSLKVMDRWGVSVFESKDYKDEWNGAGLDEGIYYFEADVLGEVQCKGWVHLIK
ncbi:MAG: PKD domain-containing protein [Bacteroidota bacterium]